MEVTIWRADDVVSCIICIFLTFSLVSTGMSGFVCIAHVQCWSKGVMPWFYLQMTVKEVLINRSNVPLSVSSSGRCCECSASLSHWYYEKDGRLFCKKDYWAKFGELCHGCNDPITTGLIMVRGSIRWLSAVFTSLVLCLLINLELQLGAVTLTARTYMQEDKHTPESIHLQPHWLVCANIRTCA